MRIEHARRKGAHNITANLERLMDWWRLMHRAGNWLKILRVECEWIQITIPADRIKRVLSQRHPREPRSILYENVDVFLFIDRKYFARPVQIALRVGRAHFDLAFMIQVTLWDSNRYDRFENEIILLLNLVRDQPVRDSTRNDDVIFGAIRQFAEDRFHHTPAVKHKNDLIGAAVFVVLKFIVCLRRPRAVRDHILIKQHRDAACVEIATPRNTSCLQMMMSQRTIGYFFWFPMFE